MPSIAYVYHTKAYVARSLPKIKVSPIISHLINGKRLCVIHLDLFQIDILTNMAIIWKKQKKN